MNPIDNDVFDRETVIESLQAFYTRNNLSIPDKYIKNLLDEEFKIVGEGVKCYVLGHQNISSKPLMVKVYKDDFEVFPGFVYVEVIKQFLKDYDLQKYFLRFKTHELSSKDLEVIRGKLHDYVLQTYGYTGKTYGINPALTAHIVPNLHYTPDDNTNTFILEFKPGGKDKISYYNMWQLYNLVNESQVERIDAEFLSKLNETYNPDEILHDNVTSANIINAFKKLIKNPMSNFKIFENGKEMYKDGLNNFRDAARKNIVDEIIEFVASDPEFIELLKNIGKFHDANNFNLHEIKRIFQDHRFSFLPSFKEMFTMRYYDCDEQKMVDNVQSIKLILLDEWKQMNNDMAPEQNVKDFYLLCRFLVFRLMVGIKLNIKVKVDMLGGNIKIKKDNVKYFLMDNILYIKDYEFSDLIKVIDDLKKVISD
eukprot:Mrub_04272.p1 GENE.Mrub_04272~~Mrub_04272.p1  ORF type:complete len:424 (-),score=89.14 Mrub_04272:15-1286(-)